LCLARTTASIVSVQKGFEEVLQERDVQINITSFYEELPVPGIGLVRLHLISSCVNVPDIFQVVTRSLATLTGFPHLPLHADHQVT